jgi:hypothetical protein
MPTRKRCNNMELCANVRLARAHVHCSVWLREQACTSEREQKEVPPTNIRGHAYPAYNLIKKLAPGQQLHGEEHHVVRFKVAARCCCCSSCWCRVQYPKRLETRDFIECIS